MPIGVLVIIFLLGILIYVAIETAIDNNRRQ